MKIISGKCAYILQLLLLIPACTYSQKERKEVNPESHILSSVQLEKFFAQPRCLEGYRSNQTGPLSRIDAKEGEKDDSTFTVEKIRIPSDGLIITGWLYVPLGKGKFPLIVLTNGGGDGSRNIKSLSDWIAPILAHCGYAAFVHDKRGTGESEGDFVKTTYDDYITDAGNCAIFLSGHPKIDSLNIGVLGGSEGGRIAVLAASRFPAVKFAISFAGTAVSMEDDRWYATMGGFKSRGFSDSQIDAVKPLWEKSFAAWAHNDPAEYTAVSREINEWRKTHDRSILPWSKAEMDSIPAFRAVLSTWYSMPNDYLAELGRFNKKWLAVFGEVDQVVPTQASIQNISKYMAVSGNRDYSIAVIPKCGHAPVDVDTKRLIRIDYLILNWLNQNIAPLSSPWAGKVTYVANEGFLIATSNHKVLIDALFGNIPGNWCEQPDDSVANLMIKGLPPFDNIDAVLVTHKHADHFNESMVTSFLINNRKPVLICPSQVDELLKKNPAYPTISDRIHTLKLDRTFDTLLIVNDISIRVMRFNHGSWFEKDTVTGKTIDLHTDVENFGYLIEPDGFRVFHSGDGSPANKAQYQEYGFAGKGIDAAFLDRVFLGSGGQELINEIIRPKNLIFMHIEPAKTEYFKSVIKSIPEMFVFTRPMQEKVIYKD